MTEIHVEQAILQNLAGGFGDLVQLFDGCGGLGGIDLSAAGDARISGSIEDFLEQSSKGTGLLMAQFSQLQQLLQATGAGYSAVETHVLAGFQGNL